MFQVDKNIIYCMNVKFSKDISVKCKMAGDYAFSWNLVILTN